MILLTKLLLAHLAGDFLLQPDSFIALAIVLLVAARIRNV